MSWAAILKALEALLGFLEKHREGLLGFALGKKMGANRVKRRNEKAREKAQEVQHEADQNYEQRRRDPDFRDRVRDALEELDAAGDE